MTSLKAFRDVATEEEQDELARRVGTTKEYLFTHLGMHRAVALKKAATIESVTREMFVRTRGRTPVIYRHALCTVCAECPFAKGEF